MNWKLAGLIILLMGGYANARTITHTALPSNITAGNIVQINVSTSYEMSYGHMNVWAMDGLGNTIHSFCSECGNEYSGSYDWTPSTGNYQVRTAAYYWLPSGAYYNTVFSAYSSVNVTATTSTTTTSTTSTTQPPTTTTTTLPVDIPTTTTLPDNYYNRIIKVEVRLFDDSNETLGFQLPSNETGYVTLACGGTVTNNKTLALGWPTVFSTKIDLDFADNLTRCEYEVHAVVEEYEDGYGYNFANDQETTIISLYPTPPEHNPPIVYDDYQLTWVEGTVMQNASNITATVSDAYVSLLDPVDESLIYTKITDNNGYYIIRGYLHANTPYLLRIGLAVNGTPPDPDNFATNIRFMTKDRGGVTVNPTIEVGVDSSSRGILNTMRTVQPVFFSILTFGTIFFILAVLFKVLDEL